MVHELALSEKRRRLTVAWIKMGLRLDDLWDFGIDRKNYSGKFLPPEELLKIANPELKQRYEKAKNALLKESERAKIPRPPGGISLQENIKRFESLIMLTEALALAVNYCPENWPPALREVYRFTDGLIWAGMYQALKPSSRLALPDLTFSIPLYTENPQIGLSRLFHHLAEHFLDQGKEGKEVLSLAYQMAFVQVKMDKADGKINNRYFSPAFLMFPKENSSEFQQWLKGRERFFLKMCDSFRQNPSLTFNLAPLFPIIYFAISSLKIWRTDVKGWKPSRLLPQQ